MKKLSVGTFYGIIGGVILLLFVVGTYLAGVEVYMSKVVFLGYAIMLLLAAAAVLTEKKRQGGFLDLRTGIKTCFTVFVIALGAQTLFNFLLLNVIDPHFKQAAWQAVVKNTGDVARRFGMPDDLVEKAVADQRSNDPYTFGRMLTGLAFYLIFYFFISLLIAAVVRRKKGTVQ
ncbi:MAG TPA: DUF4199 domain-containing protein [Puia sp.]